MNMKAFQEKFIAIAGQIEACAYAQKNWYQATFEKTFSCTKEAALINNIKVFNEEFKNLRESMYEAFGE
jgi:hypothetical protein